MPLSKIIFKPGVNRENTRYTNEGGWFECDKVRFRQGTPESIGGWERISFYNFIGICRSMWNWSTLAGLNLLGLGTSKKFYIESSGSYYDITPIRSTVTLGASPFLGNGTTTVTVTAASHGATDGSYVTFSGATGTYANDLNNEFAISYVDANSYTITVGSIIPAGSTGGAAVVAAYQINIGSDIQQTQYGWGSLTWGAGNWGQTTSSNDSIMRIWSQNNYGQDLVFGPKGSSIYYWQANSGLTSRGVLLYQQGGNVTFTVGSPVTAPALVTLTASLTDGTAVQFGATSLPTGITAGTTYYLFNVNGLTANLLDTNGAQVAVSTAGTGVYISNLVDCPVVQNYLFVSDTSRFLFAFGCNDYGSATMNPMLVRWSDQDNILEWTPDATNQAGSIQLSHGSNIVTAVQTRQEIVVFTDSTVYSMQYLGTPVVWGSQLLGDNISIMSQNAAVIASGVVYWMGVDKFYIYDGRVQTLNCDLRKFVFSDINLEQTQQIFAGTNEGFNEVWWFYCSQDSTTIDKYVVYNYLEQVWYYGAMARTAWLDSGLRSTPQAATYSYNIVNHESGINDNETGTPLPINAYISSCEFDIQDGDRYGYIWRVLPDLTFNQSTVSLEGDQPKLTMTLYPMQNSGSGVSTPASANVTKIAEYNVTEEFTGIIYTRVRGRQMIFKVESNQVNTAWQLGAPRFDIRPDGRR